MRSRTVRSHGDRVSHGDAHAVRHISFDGEDDAEDDVMAQRPRSDDPELNPIDAKFTYLVGKNCWECERLWCENKGEMAPGSAPSHKKA